MRAGAKPHRLRPVTRALLWYPAVCVAIAAVFAVVVWTDCGSLKAVGRCRSEVAGETAWVLGIVLAIGWAVLGVTWLVTYPIAAMRTRGIAEGFGPAAPRSDPTPGPAAERRDVESSRRPSPPKAEQRGAADPIRPARAARHDSPGARHQG
jgi:hypothetical protein